MTESNEIKASDRIFEDMNLCFNDSNYTIKVNKVVVDVLRKCNLKEYVRVTDNEVSIKSDMFCDCCVKIPDVYRYKVKVEQSKCKLEELAERSEKLKGSNYKDQLLSCEGKLQSIVILLESPHKDEYTESHQPKGPAQGITGNNIHNKISEILNEISKEICLQDEEYRILIINPIPFQTSLHYLHKHSLKSSYKTLRDNVWKKLWKNESVFRDNLTF